MSSRNGGFRGQMQNFDTLQTSSEALNQSLNILKDCSVSQIERLSNFLIKMAFRNCHQNIKLNIQFFGL